MGEKASRSALGGKVVDLWRQGNRAHLSCVRQVLQKGGKAGRDVSTFCVVCG